MMKQGLYHGCRSAALLAAGIGSWAPLFAATTTSFQVGATIAYGCEVNNGAGADPTFGDLDFGQHPGISSATVHAALTPNTGIVLACTPGVTLSMSVGAGQNYAGGRHMRNGTALLPYRLYRDAARSQEYTPGTSYAVTYGDPSDIRLPVFGTAQLSGNGVPGIYQDTLTVTLQW